MAKHTIWNGDAVQHYGWLKEHPDDIRDALGLDDDAEVTNDMLWDEAYCNIEADYDAECANLNIDTGMEIIAIGDLQRWNGRFSAYKELRATNIAAIVRFAGEQAAHGNTVHLYVEDGEIKLSMTGHDNPTSPTVMVFRGVKSETAKERVTNAFYHNAENRWHVARYNSVKLGRFPAKVYGWKERRKAA